VLMTLRVMVTISLTMIIIATRMGMSGMPSNGL